MKIILRTIYNSNLSISSIQICRIPENFFYVLLALATNTNSNDQLKSLENILQKMLAAEELTEEKISLLIEAGTNNMLWINENLSAIDSWLKQNHQL
jgi:hypothetical protein